MAPSFPFDNCYENLLPILQEISNAIVVTDNINTIAHLMLDMAIERTDAEKGSLMLVDPQQELTILSARGIEYTLAKTYRVKIGEGIAGTVAQKGKAVMVADIDADERFRQAKRDRYKTKSFISCPILGKKGNVLGVLNINDKKNGQPFNQSEFVLIQIIAGQAAIALKNAFLINRLKAKAAELEDANRKLIDADVGKSEFLTRISHELRTPLNSIKGSVYHLQRSENLQPDVQKEFLDIVDKEADKLVGIIEKQLDFLRLEDESRIIRKSALNLSDTLKETFGSRLLKNALAKKNLRLETDLKGGISDIVGDKVLINQLFINLLEGIICFLPTESTITLSTRENDFIEIYLEANSLFPENVLKNQFTFKPFYIDENLEGSIKLHLALKAAEIHGWRLHGENRDEGFRVSIRIPKIARQKIEAAINTTMDMLLEFTSELFGVNICSLMLLDDLTGDLVINCARGLDQEIIKRARINMTSRIAGWVAHEGKPLLVEDIEADPRFSQKTLSNRYNTKSLLSLPVKAHEKVIGVLNLNNKRTGEPFSTQDLKVAKVFTERISSLIEGIYSGSRDKDLGRLVTSLDNLVNAEKKYSKKESGITRLMNRMVDQVGLDEEDKELALYISKIYDLGLMLVDKGVLDKLDQLTPMEKSTLRSHPYTTLDLLGEIESSEKVRKIILHHHERFDGTGYPDGLKKDEIPLLSRILAVLDAFCSMTEERTYRKAFSREEAILEIRKESGTHFDPKVVEVVERVVKDVF
jgi:HD-GYP domain-containing protein (c-di-GMP phosphodiesterase class II)/signal transduction histidine kinase